MYRSGSTLLFNILKYLCKEFNLLNSSGNKLTTHKVHLDWTNPTIPQKWAFIKESCEPENLVLYSRRDIRDVICSYAVREKVAIEDFRHSGRNYIKFLEWIVANDLLIQKESNDNSNIKILNYENEIQGDERLQSLFDKILLYFEIKNTNKDLNIDKFKFLNTKKICDTLKKLEGTTQYWPNHLGDGAISKYQNILTEKQLNYIEDNKFLKSWIDRFYS